MGKNSDQGGCPNLRSLRLHSTRIIDRSLRLIGGYVAEQDNMAQFDPETGLPHLLILDIWNCVSVTPDSVVQLICQRPSLITVNSGVCGEELQLLRRIFSDKPFTGNLLILSGEAFRLFPERDDRAHCILNKNNQTLCCSYDGTLGLGLCTSKPVRPAMHCIDCGLLPETGRRMCTVCAQSCHANHRTFLGSYEAFLCDCVVSQGNPCKVFSLP